MIPPGFPKTRPPLPPEYAAIYASHYHLNRTGRTLATGLAQRLEAWLHRQVAKDVVGSTRPTTTLELGAGTLNQLRYEPDRGSYDIVEPFPELFEHSDRLSRVRTVFGDVREIPPDRRYDRITAVAVLEHLCDLPEVVVRVTELLAPGGTFRVAIPNEGTILWKLGWRLSTGLEYRWRYGLDYGVLMRYEHVNTAREIESVLRYFFGEMEVRVFGISRALSLYHFFACRQPKQLASGSR